MLISHWLKDSVKSDYWDVLRAQGKSIGSVTIQYLKTNIPKAKIFYIDVTNSAITQSLDSILVNPSLCNELFELPYDATLIESNSHGMEGAVLITKGLDSVYDYQAAAFSFDKSGKYSITPVIIFFNKGTVVRAENGDIGLSNIAIIDIMSDKFTDVIDDRIANHCAYIAETLAMISLINSPKIIDTITKPTQHFLNKKRIRNGKPPITEYHVIKLKPEIERQFRESEKNAASGKMPFHWRRGHFKALPCGLRWWNAHTVGKKENGEVVSGYLVE